MELIIATRQHCCHSSCRDRTFLLDLHNLSIPFLLSAILESSWKLTGGGSDFETDFGPLLLKIDDFTVYDFYYKGFRQLMVKKTRTGPLKILKFSKSDLLSPHIFITESFITIKIRA